MGYNDEDVVKVAILYFLHHGLIGANNKTIVMDHFFKLAYDF